MVFIASTLKDSQYRKPKKGMWDKLVKDVLAQKTLKNMDMKKSFYCGDAAGRKKPPFNDFSSDDLLFSINLGLNFYTPEMLFKDAPLNFVPVPGTCLEEKYKKKEEKKQNSKQDKALTGLREEYKKLGDTGGKRELLLLCGSPGSGKSTFWREYLSKTHIIINNDTIKNPKKA